jgi:alpha-ketoglutarate-dependent 2,4-dichlorophenoxyacetate dioxygenase
MGLSVRRLHPHFAAEITGVYLRDLDDPTFCQLRDAFEEHSVLVFHDQRLSDDAQRAFSERFGPLEITINSIGQERRLHPNLVDLSNLDPGDDGRLMDWSDRRMLYQSGNQLWHTDSSFKHVPAKCSLFSARELPSSGGETEFADLRAAWDALREAK